ncbi:MAG: adenosine kinase [Spirochaetes bacterium]|nr:adenosine kinase [Spirochaetota bacterium]
MASVFIICNPLSDTIVPSEYAQIEKWSITPGSMNLVEYSLIEKIKREATILAITPGGSGANTARGIAWLSKKTTHPLDVYFLGAVGNDIEGETLIHLLKDAGVKPLLVRKRGSKTGTSLVLVTPDHERTMCTYLGACRELGLEDLPENTIQQADILYLTGYNWDTPNQREVVQRAAEIAKRAGRLIFLDVSDPFLVHRYRDLLLNWIPGRVDLLFGNRDELRALTGTEGDEQILTKAVTLVPTVVMKIGKEGCWIGTAGTHIRVPATETEVKDTTGAGDAFAAGYLFAFLQGSSPAQCGELANRLAGGIVSVYGCDYSKLELSKVLGDSLELGTKHSSNV